MNKFQIFKSGKRTSSEGREINFGESDLQKTVEAYDPALHEAPIVIGHPKDNHPAYGWIEKLEFNDGELSADAIQVEENFAEMVKAGRFKKRSASFYSPDSPSNPVPGVFYLRHVGFLGAQAPAVKGMKDISFNEQEEGVVEFSEGWVVKGIMERLREFIIDKFSVENADQVVPKYLIDALAEDEKASESLPAFNENLKGDNVNIEELKAENDKLKSENEKLKADNASFSEREKTVAERESALERKEVESQVESFAEKGLITPAQKDQALATALSLSNEKTIDFGEGDEKTQISARENFFNMLKAQSKAVDFNEHTGGEGEKEVSQAEVVKRAQQLYDAKEANSYTEAVEKATLELTS